jgi:hypothetical protein
MWSVLTNKAPTWDILQKRNFSDPGRFPLCKSDEEMAQHLFIDCLYIKKVWTEVSRLLKKKLSLDRPHFGTSLEELVGEQRF